MLLAAVMLCVQLGAFLHAYGHRDVERTGGMPATEQCLYCKASVPLLGAAAAPSLLAILLPILLLLRVAHRAALAPVGFRHPAFRSRAPPSSTAH